MWHLLVFCSLLLLSSVHCNTLLLSTGVEDVSHIKSALSVVDHVEAEHYVDVDLFAYTDVIVALNSGSLNSKDAQVLKIFVENGGRLVFFGGSTSSSFHDTLSEVIMFEERSWRQPGTTVSIWDDACQLTTFLQDSVVITDESSFRTFGVVADPLARVCLRDETGVPAVFAKPFGQGVLSYINLSPDAKFYQSSSTQTFLRHLLSNALLLSAGQAKWDRPDALMVYSIVSDRYMQTTIFETLVANHYKHGYRSYDVIYTNNFDKLPLSEYKHVNLYINGNSHSTSTFKALYDAVDKGLKLTVFGGSTGLSSALSNSNLLKTNTMSSSWFSSKGVYLSDLPNHPLTEGLNVDLSFIDTSIGKYSVKVTDPNATVALRNADGWPFLLTKQIGKGFITFSTFTTVNELKPLDKHSLLKIVDNCFSLRYREAEYITHEVLLIQTFSAESPVDLLPTEWFLREEGIKYNVVATNEYDDVNPSPYETIIIVFNGGSFPSQQMNIINSWLEKGKRVVFYGGSSASSYLSLMDSMFIKLRTTRTQWTRRSADIDLMVVDPSDPLTFNLPKEHSFKKSSCRSSAVDIADPSARVSIRRENGLGFPLAATKVVSGGVVVLIDFAPGTSCDADEDRDYFNQLLLNSLKIKAKDTEWTRNKVLLSITASNSDDSPLEMKGLHYALIDAGIDYDFIMPNSFNINDLESYSTYFIAYNGGSFASDQVKDIEYLMANNKRVYFWGGSRSQSFNANFRDVFHITTNYDWISTGLPHLESFETGRFNTKLPFNATFDKTLKYCIRPSGRDGVIYQRNGDGYGAVACKSTQDWGNSIFALTTFVPDFDRNSSLFSYVRQLVLNFFQLAPSDCKSRKRNHAIQLSHSESMVPSQFKTAIDSAQAALGGKPFNLGGNPEFDFYFGDKDLFNPADYHSIFIMLNGYDFDTSFYERLNNTMLSSRIKVFFSGGSGTSSFAGNLNKYLLRNSYPGRWQTSTQPTYRLTSSHDLTRSLPQQHEGDRSSRSYVVKVDDGSARTLAVNGDGMPFLVQKRVGSSGFAYVVCPFSDWEVQDLFVQNVLIHNFYLYF
ncbi:hypothetical protein P9112_003847 [Eukaryota sp. TZLM1-RC]